MSQKIWHTILILIPLWCLFPEKALGSNVVSDPFEPSQQVMHLIRDGKRAKAARFLNDSLSNKRIAPGDESRTGWLVTGIFWFLADSSSQAQVAYNIYKGLRGPKSEMGNEMANRIFFYALELAAENQIKMASDTLLNSLALRKTETVLDSILLAESLNCLARFYKRTGDSHESLRYFERSLMINRKLNRDFCIADNLSDMSSVLFGINRHDPRADSTLVEALAIFRRIQDFPSLSTVYNELGAMAVARDSIKLALVYFKESLSIKNSIPDYKRSETLIVLNNLGSVYSNLFISDRASTNKYLDSSRSYFNQALKFAKESGKSLAPYYVNLGVTFSKQKNFDKGLKYFQLALGSLDTLCDGNDLASNPHIQAASPNLADFTSYKAHALNFRFKKAHNINDLVQGLSTYLISLDMMDTLRYTYTFESKPLLGKEFKIHFFHALEMALDLYANTGSTNYLDQAFQLAGRNKAATLNEFIRSNASRKYFEKGESLLIHEDSIKQLINTLKSGLLESGENASPKLAETVTINNRIANLTDELRVLQNRIHKENPDLYRLIYSNRGYSLDSIQRLIGPGEALLDYTLIYKQLLIGFIITRDSVGFFRDTLPSDFSKQLETFKKSMTTNVSSKVFREYVSTANYLFKKLVAPAGIPESVTRLIVLPDEEVGFLPFEAFLTDTIVPMVSDFSKLHYMNRQYSISYISSHEQLYRIRSKPLQSDILRIEAFAPFTRHGFHSGQTDLPALSYSSEEIRIISKEFQTKQFTGNLGTEKNILRSFSRPVLVHISTHGVLNLTHPMESRLLFNPSGSDGNLYLFEILSLKVKAPLVILNACNTGTGELQEGEGIMSMARAFQFAGVPSLVTTLWTVDDRASSRIASLFFRNMRNGLDRREALQRARNTYLDESPLTVSAPYYWAAQILIGDTGNLTIVSTRAFPYLLVVGALFSALLLGVLIYRKKPR